MKSRFAVPRVVAVLALIVALAGAMDLLAASTAQAQDNYKTITRLGGGNRFDPPLKDTGIGPEVGGEEADADGIADVLGKAGLSSLNADGHRHPDEGVAGPVEGNRVRAGHHDGLDGVPPRRRTADIVRNVKWGGKKPFPGFTFIIDDMNQTYTFILPKPCSNIALMSSEPSREKARLDAEKAAARQGRGRQARRREGRRRARAPRGRAPRARARRGRAPRAGEGGGRERPPPSAPPPRRPPRTRPRPSALAADEDAKVDLFVSPLFGKERRTREVEMRLRQPPRR